jgi:hypothetical protein
VASAPDTEVSQALMDAWVDEIEKRY